MDGFHKQGRLEKKLYLKETDTLSKEIQITEHKVHSVAKLYDEHSRLKIFGLALSGLASSYTSSKVPSG